MRLLKNWGDWVSSSMHIPVLTNEVLSLLPTKRDLRVVDGTLNGAGHTAAILEARTDARVLGIEWDPTLTAAMTKRYHELGERLTVVNDSYTNMEHICRQHSFVPDAVLLDLGLSTWHYVESGRGFSFLREETLDMRFNPERTAMTASELVNTYDQARLEQVLLVDGEERFAPEIAAAIIQQRRREPILTTLQLVTVIEHAVPAWYRHRRIHCATKTFQALRISVNRELDTVLAGIDAALKTLHRGGRLMVISFHGGEDKIVRERFKDAVKAGEASWVQRRTIRPSWDEVQENRRARSAKLKVIEIV